MKNIPVFCRILDGIGNCSLCFCSLVVVILLLLAEAVEASPDNSIVFRGPAVAYQPRGYSPKVETQNITLQGIREDLVLLRQTGFRGLVTYSSKGVLGKIPQLAREQGFDGTVIMGIWDLSSRDEWRNALAQRQFVDGYVIGNEGLGVRYSSELLAKKINEMKEISDLPITTTEPIEHYLSGPYQTVLLNHSDWLFPFAHPLWAGFVEPEKAIQWTTTQHDYLVAVFGKQVLFKEVGFPSAGDIGLNEENQLSFFQGLKKTGIPFFHFEAFDQPWKQTEPGFTKVEVHWGLFNGDGSPKKVANWLDSYVKD